MKIFYTFLFFLGYVGLSNAQQASEYFPNQIGYEWKYKAIPLDSVGDPVNALAYYRMDKFEAVADYNGKLANIVLTKSGPLQTILLQPYLDSLFYHTEGTNGFEYFSIKRIEEFLNQLDSLEIDPNFSFVEFFTSLQDWYSVYRFASGINSAYTLISKDTTIGVYPLLFEYLGTRLQDQTIQTVLGSFNCKKFLTQWKVSYRLLPPPFPPIELITTNDTIWIAPNNWIVQDIIPSNPIDLSLLGIDPFFIPGLDTRLTDEIVSVANQELAPNKFLLEQNYPNPFNPSTKIKYSIPQSSDVTIKVFNMLGKEIETLIIGEKPAGIYNLTWNAANLPSGIYFYQLKAGEFIETKKMILLK